jgi:two-component system, OmpR family, response regulator VanR
MSDIKELISYAKSLDILYVEDDMAIRDNYAKIFKDLFASAALAADGKEGWDTYRSTPFDIVITDINMPVMNGVEMIKNIVAKNAQQAIVVISAQDEPQCHLQLNDLGVEEFLIKPLDFQKLISTLLNISKRLSKHKAHQE